MNQLIVSLACCWAQALVVATLAIGLSALAMRRSPAAGAAIAWTGVLATLGLTLLSPVPPPRWNLRLHATGDPSISSEAASSAAADKSMANEISSNGAADGSHPSAAINLELLRGILASVQRSQAAVANHGSAGRIALGLLALGAGLHLIRTLGGLWAIAALRRNSRPIAGDHCGDERLAAVLNELALALGLRRLPQVRESAALVSAAVIGWWRPAVVLPAGWREWTAAELKAVIAHELAHIARGDFVLRLVAALAVALQSAQPTVYWLRRRLILAQELAADELAASVVGSRTEYLHALTRLALRQDSRPIDGSVGLLLPVFSGFLLRRIEMLRAKDGSPRRLRLTLQWSAIAIVTLTAACTTALRGLAQPPETQPDGSVRVATATDIKSKPANSPAGETDQAKALFQRPRLDLVTIGMGDRGGFLIRLGEFLNRAGAEEGAEEFAGELKESFLEGWKDTFPMAEAPTWSLQDIEYIAGDFALTVKPAPRPKKDYSNQMIFGSSFATVRWQKPLSGQFESLLRIPGAVEKSHHDSVYVELPTIPLLGPGKPCVCRIDDRTLLAAQNETILHTQLDKLGVPASPPAWQNAWKGVEGGWLTLVATDKQIARPLSEPVDDDAKLYNDLFTHARVHAIGLDWQEPAYGITCAKMQFRFDTQKEALQVQIAIKRLIDQAMNELRQSADKIEKEQAKAFAESSLKFLESAKVDNQRVDGGWRVEVQFAGPLGLQAILKQ